MKLATLADGTRDGCLHVVTRDLSRAAPAVEIARTLQGALDDWSEAEPRLRMLSDRLHAGEATQARPFDPSQAMAPLPRAYQWLDASAFLSHGKLMQRAFNRPPAPDEETVPQMYQGGSDAFLAPHEDAPFRDPADEIDLEAEFGVILDETPMGASPEAGAAAIRLLVLINDWSLRAYGPREMKTGFGFLQAKPATAFAPVAVTPDELGAAWTDGRVGLDVEVTVRGERLGRLSGTAMQFSAGELVAHAARTRRLAAGAILGFGTVSSPDAERVGSACLTERRALDAIAGRPATPYLGFGDTVQIEAFDADGHTMFGAIAQSIIRTP